MSFNSRLVNVSNINVLNRESNESQTANNTHNIWQINALIDDIEQNSQLSKTIQFVVKMKSNGKTSLDIWPWMLTDIKTLVSLKQREHFFKICRDVYDFQIYSNSVDGTLQITVL